MAIHYRNTDLDLASPDKLTALLAAFEAAGLVLMDDPELEADGLWHVSVEAIQAFDREEEPEDTIAKLLDVVESLAGPLRSAWDRCTLRDFNIGYSAGEERHCHKLEQGLSRALLDRLSRAGGTLRITIYMP